MRYKVSVSYHDFLFDNLADACSFAQAAKKHYFDKRDKDADISVEITLVDEDEYNNMINKMMED